MKNAKTLLGARILFGGGLLLALNLAAAPAAAGGNASLKNEISLAIDGGIRWLVKEQAPEGHWSEKDQPALTALPLVAIQGRREPGREETLRKGYAFLLSHAHEDGSIYGKKELVNYNTSLGMMAFLAAPDQTVYRDTILKARRYLLGTQIDLGVKGEIDTPFDGGIGYGSKGDHSDLANTLAALEALRYSQGLAADREPQAPKLNFAAAIHFLESCQNLPSHNKEKWASDDPANKGGFVYAPGESKAGETNLPSGKVALRSYGSISYAGLLSYIYADLKKEDPRVQAVLQWLRENYTVQENPGMGPQGLFYYYHTMTKALTASGVDSIQTKDGKSVQWREQVALRLIDLQKRDGSWANESGRWLEKDPALVTAYALITLEMISARL